MHTAESTSSEENTWSKHAYTPSKSSKKEIWKIQFS